MEIEFSFGSSSGFGQKVREGFIKAADIRYGFGWRPPMALADLGLTAERGGGRLQLRQRA